MALVTIRYTDTDRDTRIKEMNEYFKSNPLHALQSSTLEFFIVEDDPLPPTPITITDRELLDEIKRERGFTP